MNSQWEGKKVAFLGDSITDACHVGTTKNYWQYLQEYLGIQPLVYGLNGWRWEGIKTQSEKLKAEHGDDVDAIFIFMGTNDYNGGVPLGHWWNTREEEIISHGKQMKKIRRIPSKDPKTLCGCINTGMEYLKENFPLQQIVLMTPIHRGFAEFGGDNIQPEESYPNDIDIYVHTYIDLLREAGDIWAVPVIDLFSESGLFPVMASYFPYFHDAKTDRLHPNAAGHERIAKTMMYRMLAMPATFR